MKEHELNGRQMLRYQHDSLKEWGYAEQKPQYFSMALAKRTGGPAPLIVILHSAGGPDEKETPEIAKEVNTAGEEFYGLALNCYKDEWWWGAHQIKEQPEKYAVQLTPVERRVMATVEWAAQNYPIDRNRIYLVGRSMGGTGSLGIGYPRGDVFAAIYITVAAGVEHFFHRMGLSPASPSSSAKRGIPDPPPLLSFISHMDTTYAVGQEDFIRAAREARMPLILAWEPFGHTGDVSSANPAAYEFPWLNIRKNEAYPVFTNASSDNRYPGLGGKEPDQSGQINAYFRWKVLEDSPKRLAIELRLVRNEELTRQITLPDRVLVDVTPRRLQQFKARPGSYYKWKLSRGSQTVTNGSIQADANGPLTIPQIPVRAEPAVLSIIQ